MTQAERRASKRIPVLATFAFFVTVPKKGGYRLPLYNLSDKGIGFDLDIEGESGSHFQVALGDQVEIQIHLNPSLSISTSVKIKRLENIDKIRRVGADFLEKEGKPYTALKDLVRLLDHLVELSPK